MTSVTIRRLKKTAVVAAVLVTAPFTMQSPAAAAPSSPPDGGTPAASPNDDRPLGNASLRTLVGSHTAGGGCTFRLPELELAPSGTAIEARQLDTNFADCTTTVEVGTPLTDADAATEGTFDNEVATPVGRASRSDDQFGVTATSSSGYYRVWWEDVINLRVHEVKTNISWTWDGSCVTASSGSANYWWLSGTGWSKNSSSSYIARSCSNARVYTDATYKNGAFCWPGTVWSYYDNVTAQGKSDGWLYGWVDGTWTTYPFACPTLHFHTELKRVTG